ncbi:hypothetical protein [Nocardioides seonyuensis]|uniref:hypothetical protein n=1 Tax=Nocardioides seonyuensis TaxID=2518371 RepID=UPI001FC93158|nr:hypothetical protein [Nocardioides seonyuensis]
MGATPTTSTPAARPSRAGGADHPELAEALKDILGETYGLIVYQEQVMAIAQKLAGYTLGQADLLRRPWARRRRRSWTSSSRPSPAACRSAATHRLPSRRSGTSCCPSPTTPSTGPLRGLRGGQLLHRLPQGQLPG